MTFRRILSPTKLLYIISNISHLGVDSDVQFSFKEHLKRFKEIKNSFFVIVMIQCTKSNCLFRRKTNIFTFPTFILTFKKLLQIEIKICNMFIANGQAYLRKKHRYLISIRIAVFTFSTEV